MVAATPAPLAAPRRLGRYTLRHPIAKGGMATVYLAQLSGAHGFEQWVAVKVMHPHLADDRRFVTMFLDEAQMTAGIRHPNACQVLDFGEEDGTPYIVLEYLEGETLSSLAKRGWDEDGLPRWLVARAVSDAARGLHAAHELRGPDGKSRNLVHRDVSPSNILVLYDGMAKIMDFGVASAEDRLTETTAGELKGKFAYMSPEHLQGQPVDRRADVWSLGVVLWEVSVGKRLFKADGHGQTAVAVLEQTIPDPRDLRADYPDELAEVVLGALKRDLDRRTPTCKAIADALDRYLMSTGELVTAERVADWMGERFADRRAKRQALMTRSGDTEVVAPLLTESPSQSSLGNSFSYSHVAPASATAGGEARSSTWKIVAAALLAALASAAGVYFAIRGGPEDVTAGAAPPPLAQRIAPPDPAASADPASTAGAAEPAPEPVGAAPGSEAEPADDGADVAETEPAAEPEAPEGSALEAAPTEAPANESPADPDPSGGAPESPARTGRRAPRPRAPAVAPSPAAAPQAAPGSLNLLAIPPSEVRLGGRLLGTTPLLGVELPAGQHRLQLRPVGGGEERALTVRIRSGERTSRSVSLATL